MFSFGYSFFLSGPIIGYTSLSYFYIFSIVFACLHPVGRNSMRANAAKFVIMNCLFIFSSCFVLIHNRFGVSPLTDGIPLFFENGINTGIFIFWGAVRIVYECHKLFETSFAAHTKTFA